MAIPLQTQLFDAYLGTQEGIHSIILPDVFSSGGSNNMWIDKYGRAKKVDGYAKQNSTAVTTDTGGSATMLRGMFPYRKTSGGSITRQLVGCFDDQADEFEFWKSTDDGVTWAFLADLGSTVINQIPDFSQFGDTLYTTTGKVAPQKWDGTTWATTGRTQSPQATVTESSSVGNLLGNYTYKLVSVNSSGVRSPGSAKSTVNAMTNKQASLTWTADADTSIVGYEIYRTTGTGAVFYFVTYSDGRTSPVAYTDNIADLTILQNRVLQEHGDAPPTTYFCEPHKQRMWYGKTDAAPTRAYWSDPGLPEDVLSDNFLDFSDGETAGDQLTGMVGNYEGRLVVLTERAIWTVSGTGQVIGDDMDWSRIRTNAQTGAVTHRTIARIPAGAKYVDPNGKSVDTNVVTLAYLTPLGDIRIFDGESDIVISHPVKTTVALMSTNFSQRQKAFSILDTKRAEVSWLFATGTAAEPNTCVTWNYRWGVWYKRDWAFSCGIESENATTAQFLLAGESATTTGGTAYLLWSGNSNNGVNINAVWMTKTLYGLQLVHYSAQPALSQTKRWRWVDFVFETEQTATLTLEWLAGNSPDNGAAVGSTTFIPSAALLVSGDLGDTLISSDGASILVSQLSTLQRVPLKVGSRYTHDTGIRLRIGDNAQTGSWSLEGMNLAYQILPGLQRRNAIGD